MHALQCGLQQTFSGSQQAGCCTSKLQSALVTGMATWMCVISLHSLQLALRRSPHIQSRKATALCSCRAHLLPLLLQGLMLTL